MLGMNFEIKPGGIYKLQFPFNDANSKKARPALALSKPDRRGDIKFVFITKNPPEDDETNFLISQDDFVDNPLPFKSYLRIDNPFLLNKNLVIKTLAVLSSIAFARVLRLTITMNIPMLFDIEHEKKSFLPGLTHIPAAGKVIDENEIHNMVESAMDGWLTAGRFNETFEAQLAKFLV